MAKKPTPPPAEVTPEPDFEISESDIRAKILAGLTRDQAIEVITRQRQHDAAV